MAKTNWTYEDIVKPEDMNELGQEINDNKSTAQLARQKAEEAQQMADGAKQSSVNKIAIYGGADKNIDPNNTTDPYVLTSHANTPSGDSAYWHIRTYFYRSTSDNRAQLAIRYNGPDEMYIRKCVDGAWYSWKPVSLNFDPNTKADKSAFDSHVNNKANPHGVTKAQVGLGSVDNAKQATKAEFDAHASETTAHGATRSLVPNRIPIRDDTGNFYVSAPTDGWHVARKVEVDAAETNAINWAKSFGLGANIPFSSDLNTLPLNRDTGFYMTNGETKNVPPGVYADGSVIHIARDSRPSQIFISYGTGRMFHRGYTAAGWQQWYEIWTSSSFDPTSKFDKTGGEISGGLTTLGNTFVGARKQYGGSPTITLAIGDSDTGIGWSGDGAISIYANSAEVARINSSSFNVVKNLFQNGNTVYHTGNNPASKAMHGYQRLASGVILQWVLSTPPTPGRNKINFPIAFPTLVGAAVVTPRLFNAEMGSAVITDLSNAQAEVHLDYSGGGTGGGRGYTLFAIGY